MTTPLQDEFGEGEEGNEGSSFGPWAAAGVRETNLTYVVPVGDTVQMESVRPRGGAEADRPSLRARWASRARSEGAGDPFVVVPAPAVAEGGRQEPEEVETYVVGPDGVLQREVVEDPRQRAGRYEQTSMRDRGWLPVPPFGRRRESHSRTAGPQRSGWAPERPRAGRNEAIVAELQRLASGAEVPRRRDIRLFVPDAPAMAPTVGRHHVSVPRPYHVPTVPHGLPGYAPSYAGTPPISLMRLRGPIPYSFQAGQMLRRVVTRCPNCHMHSEHDV